jgi:hypothetical protein
MSVASWRQIASPSPVPPCWRLAGVSAWVNQGPAPCHQAAPVSRHRAREVQEHRGHHQAQQSERKQQRVGVQRAGFKRGHHCISDFVHQCPKWDVARGN